MTNYTEMKNGTKNDYELQAELYSNITTGKRQCERILWLLKQLGNQICFISSWDLYSQYLDHPETGVGVGSKVNLFQHSLQSATRVFNDGGDEELIVAALLHDIGELLSPSSHGDVAAGIINLIIFPINSWSTCKISGILLPYVSERTWW